MDIVRTIKCVRRYADQPACMLPGELSLCWNDETHGDRGGFCARTQYIIDKIKEQPTLYNYLPIKGSKEADLLDILYKPIDCLKFE